MKRGRDCNSDEHLQQASSSSSFSCNDTLSLALSCDMCGHLLSDFEMYRSHLELVHKLTDYFSCPVEGCYRVYNSAPAMKCHLEHSHELNKSKQVQLNLHATDSCHASNFETHNVEIPSRAHESEKNFTLEDNSKPNTLEEPALELNNDFSAEIENIVAYLYDIINIPRSVIQTIYSLIKSLVNNLSDEI